MLRRTIVLFVVAITITAACSDSPVAPSELQGGTWKLVSLQEQGADPITVETPDRYTLKFDDETNVAVASDCNTCSATYALDDSSLELVGISCTKVMCEASSLDPVYSKALERVRTVSTEGSEMTIEGDGLKMRFTR